MSRRSRIALRLLCVLAGVSVLTTASAVVVLNNNRTGVAAHLESSTDMFVPGDDLGTDADRDGVPASPGAVRLTRDGAVFGQEGGRKTLVLYDLGGSEPRQSELYALNAALLASHFGTVTVQAAEKYRSGSIDEFDATLYVGHNPDAVLPSALRTDVVTSDRPVIWAGDNVDQLNGPTARSNSAFRARYGWNPDRTIRSDDDRPGGITYRGQVLNRDNANNVQGINAPLLGSDPTVTVLAEAPCGDPANPSPCIAPELNAKTSQPWAIRSANLTYVAEVPFDYVLENDRYLAYADLLYDALHPDVEPIRQAAVRLEDVSPVTDPTALRANVDYLASQNIPFSIAVIPRYLDPEGRENGGRPTSVTLEQSPALVATLKYAQSKGGTLVQHGTTHQFQEIHNPYNAVSAADFEFYYASCEDPANRTGAMGSCAIDSPIFVAHPIGNDTVAGWRARIDHGRQLFDDAGLTTPEIFETPHYAASTNAYRAMSQFYRYRYERISFPTGLITGAPPGTDLLSVHFPYRVTDPFGNVVLPENLGNYAPASFGGHAAREPEEIIANARANLVVRESTASFFYHGYLPPDELARTVTGIQELGYRFVPPNDLR